MSWASKYTHIPFLDRGRTEEGLDCWGLVCEIFKKERRINLQSYAELYGSTEDSDACADIVASEAAANWEEVKDYPKCFDVVVLKVRGLPTHVGVVIDGTNMIHCCVGVGTAIESMKSMKWEKKIMGFYRWVM